ncbi:MAG: aminodeoxychorismate/anthranilate synthase component II [Eubacteriales bacterium]|nr:aminodeoxychorismate/anthranilate synthase component II [Eubacteriales bacterium]
MIFLIDNYDSFSYNLFQLVGEMDADIKVIRNDEMTVEEIRELKPDRIILSPGPGRPEDAGIIVDVVKSIHHIPILGVCLGHQAICAAFGATVTYAKELMHGKQSDVIFDGDCPLFRDCPEVAPVARYHSLAADADTIPEELRISARTTDGEVMAVWHRDYPIYGVQFHPESIMTPAGRQMLENFVNEGDRNHD